MPPLIFRFALFVFSLPLLCGAADDLGKELYAQCAGCHGAKGQGTKTGPPLVKLTQRKSLIRGGAPTEANIAKLIQKGSGVMQGFPHIDGSDLKAPLTYLKTL